MSPMNPKKRKKSIKCLKTWTWAIRNGNNVGKDEAHNRHGFY